MDNGLFCLPPGVDFPVALVQGLRARYPEPEALARVTVITNTSRMLRRIVDVFAAGPATLRPRLITLADLGNDPLLDLPPALPSLRRELELTALLKRLLDVDSSIAPKQSLPALARSLATLLDEMNGEGVGAEALAALDVSDQSDHWQRALRFVTLAHDFIANHSDGPDAATRQRAAIMAQIARWGQTGARDPVVIAGSTGSRGATADLMDFVARQPWGSVVLPGLDRHMPPAVSRSLTLTPNGQDHPQYRLAAIADRLGLTLADVPLWAETEPVCPQRNALISLALRPAPATDQWLCDGPLLPDLNAATKGITLIEAPSPRIEAEAIALGLRDAVVRGKSAALITPNRELSRQVSAALSRWGIRPDDSAGLPLQLTPPGRLLRIVARMRTGVVDSETLLIALKQSLSHRGSDRGPHLRWTQELETHMRRTGLAFPSHETLQTWAAPHGEDAVAWANWVAGLLPPAPEGDQPIPTHVLDHIARAEYLARGPSDLEHPLWDGEAGAEAARLLDELRANGHLGAEMTPQDYVALVDDALAQSGIRQAGDVHPSVLIWGTLETRAQNADVMILAGLVEGTWPESPSPDPWLNRSMRAQAGLLLPDRAIGLAAHDFQQAIAAPEVWITRAVRSGDGETVPSRWVNRLVNLLGGLTDGAPALAAMRQRGEQWVDRARGLHALRIDPVPAQRPSPRPPIDARPKRLRITDMALLWRDPYAVYAREVLGLSPLPPLVQSADARVKGIAIHEVMERFNNANLIHSDHPGPAFLTTAREVLDQLCPWPTARLMWMGQVQRNLTDIIQAETARAALADEVTSETKGHIEIPQTGVTVTGRADRIDVLSDGRVMIYDYKTGAAPSVKQQLVFDKQLLIEAAMLEQGAFPEIGPSPVAGAAYLRIGAKIETISAPLDKAPTHLIWEELQAFLYRWMQPDQGYTARMAAEKDSVARDYDGLSRYGEWSISDRATPEDMT